MGVWSNPLSIAVTHAKCAYVFIVFYGGVLKKLPTLFWTFRLAECWKNTTPSTRIVCNNRLFDKCGGSNKPVFLIKLLYLHRGWRWYMPYMQLLWRSKNVKQSNMQINIRHSTLNELIKVTYDNIVCDSNYTNPTFSSQVRTGHGVILHLIYCTYLSCIWQTSATPIILPWDVLVV